MTKEELKPSDRSSDFLAVLLTSYQEIICKMCIAQSEGGGVVSTQR